MGPRGVEVAAPGLELGAQDQHLVRPVGGGCPQRLGADAFGFLPLTGGDQGFDMVGAERAVLDAVRLDDSDPLRRQTGRLPVPPQHRQHVGEPGIRSIQILGRSRLLGQSQRLPESCEPVVAVAEIGEVDPEHAPRPDLGRAWADRAGERKRLLADRPRLVVAPGQHQRVPERGQHLRALRGRRLRRHELDARARTRRRPRRGDRANSK